MRIRQMLLVALVLGCACAFGAGTKELGGKGGTPGAAARKLQTCDFLLNKGFKKNAKYYLCLFSASRCGPCRREMPRIAKTYAESLKNDPNIELIHFSRDQNDEKALAWAKEHNVKFPVVKPTGGNPLDLHTRGIPHLFIVKSDGTLIEEGHPASLFTDEKIRELKAANRGAGGKGKSALAVEKTTDAKLPYEVVDGTVVIGKATGRSGRRGSSKQKYFEVELSSGELVIPDDIDGVPVRSIESGAFSDCKGMVSVTIPSSVTSIGRSAFSFCSGLTNVTMCGERPDAPSGLFLGRGKLKTIRVPTNAKSWAGMKKWQSIPLVFDGESDSLDSAQVSATAEKLKGCDFLLNKRFKKNAKYYLCLFSASWCPPCRAEMPRIAKTYAESLKNDPNIELIHFSRDQNDEKALAWAKEHDVKFPVVKPNGGNPLDLHTRGIPHLFIVDADGKLVEGGHPMRLFTEDKFRELNAGD